MKCKCLDPGCPAHIDNPKCVNTATDRVFHTDMDDKDGTPMCQDCAIDALSAGNFRAETL